MRRQLGATVRNIATMSRQVWGFGAGLALLWLVSPAGAAGPGSNSAIRAQRMSGIHVEGAPRLVADSLYLTCFQDSLTLLINPGCFSPPTPSGDCRTQSTYYFVQYLTPVPDFPVPYRITHMRFISNDAATIFPSAGIVLIPVAEDRWPTQAELGALQAHNVQSAEDLGIIDIDLSSSNILVTSGTEVVICLQFPQGQQLTAVGVGPAIVVDEVLPDNNCDFMTITAGANPATDWYRPAEDDPLDWGFQLIFEPTVAVQGKTWTALKQLYGGSSIFPYKTP